MSKKKKSFRQELCALMKRHVKNGKRLADILPVMESVVSDARAAILIRESPYFP